MIKRKQKHKRTNTNLQSNTQKTKYRATRSPLKTGGNLEYYTYCNIFNLRDSEVVICNRHMMDPKERHHQNKEHLQRWKKYRL